MTEFTLNIRLTASEELLEVFRAFTPFFVASVKQPVTEVTNKRERKEKVQIAEQATTETTNKDTAAAATPETTITHETVRAAVIEKSGKKNEIQALLKKYEAKNVTSLQESQLADFLEDLKAI